MHTIATNAFIIASIDGADRVNVRSDDIGLNHVPGFDIARLKNRDPDDWRLIDWRESAIKNKSIWLAHDIDSVLIDCNKQNNSMVAH
jgi:hypothetical protein